MTGPTTLSVLMPAYQAADTIGAAISGLLTQTWPGSLQIIIVDDGSTDDTAAIASAYGDRVTLVRQENAGTARARNVALSHAEGDFVALCDADDILLPPYLQAAVDTWAAAGGGRRFVTCDAMLLTPTGIAHGRRAMFPPVPPAPQQRLAILQANVVCGFVVAPREMFTELGGWTPSCYLEDWDLWRRAIYAGWEAVAQTTPHALYRWSDTSKSTRGDRVYQAEDELLRAVLADEPNLRTDERAYLQARLESRSPRLLLHEGDQALRVGDAGRARACYRTAAQLMPVSRSLRWKSRALAVPGVAPLLRHRLGRIDTGMGRDTDIAR